MNTRGAQSIQSNKQLPILGLDFGGSNCAAAYYYRGTLEPIMADEDIEDCDFNSKTLSSYVGFDKNEKFIFGNKARAKWRDSEYVIFNKIKQKIYEGTAITHNNASIKPQLLLTEIFNHLKKKAELELGLFIKHCVLTTPANFGEQTKMALREAANLADLIVIRFINEPTAAALYYSRYVSVQSQSCLIIDLGSMTVDMTICHISKDFIDIEHTAGDPSCGFNMLDELIRDYIKEHINKKCPGLTYNETDDKLLLQYAEKLKIEFCTKTFTINIKKEIALSEKTVLLHFDFTQENMNLLFSSYFKKVQAVYNKLFKSSVYDPREIHRVILIGGPVISPYVRKKLEEFIDIPAAKNIDPLFAVCKGAALYGAIIYNYDEENKILSDVTSISLGVETENNINEIIIPSNSRIPCSRRVEFTTSDDFQKFAKINVLEGQRLIADHCKLLGTYILTGIEQNYKGAPIIELEYSIDYDGILKVQVTDLKSLSRICGILKVNQELTCAEKEELKELAHKYRTEDLHYINKIKSAQKLNDLLNTYKQIVNKSFIKDNPLENIYLDAIHELNAPPLDYEKITSYLLRFEKFCYEHRSAAETQKSDIKKLI